jgi:hypothetical protein
MRSLFLSLCYSSLPSWAFGGLHSVCTCLKCCQRRPSTCLER